MSATAITAAPARSGPAGYVLAWGFCLLFYFGQYALRSAPGVMVPELETTFGLTTLGVSSLVGLYYYTYSTFAASWRKLTKQRNQALSIDVEAATP